MGTVDTAMNIVLAAGGTGVTGKINVINHWTAKVGATVGN
jgi:hypothetical protein